MYYPEGMKARVSPVKSIEPHKILAPTRDLNREPLGPQSRVVTTILPLHTMCSRFAVQEVGGSGARDFCFSGFLRKAFHRFVGTIQSMVPGQGQESLFHGFVYY